MSADGSAVAERPTASNEPVLYGVSDAAVALITLNRPERRNAWGGSLTSTFFRCVTEAEADAHVRVIVVTGTGRAFCVGADMGDLNSISRTTVESAGQTDVTALVAEQHPYSLTQLSKPVIAAINGSVAGIGLSLALIADVRFAAAGAKFTTSFARRGLVAEYGISWILPRLAGWGRRRRPAVVRSHVPSRGSGRAGTGPQGLARRAIAGPHLGLCPRHRDQLRAQFTGRDEASAR